MRVLRTDRLKLVPVTAANAGVLWDVLQEPDLRDYQDLPDVDARQFARAVESRPAQLEPGVAGRFEWLVYFREGQDAGRALGWVSLRIAERSTSTAEIGYSIVRAFRGSGVATEAARALVSEGFVRGGLRRIRAYCVPENRASRAVLERLGFEGDGMLPHGATVQGHPVDVIAHTLEREQWQASLKKSRSATGS